MNKRKHPICIIYHYSKYAQFLRIIKELNLHLVNFFKNFKIYEES